jgi:2,5-diketo-D-gluconate reductase B
MAGAIDRFAVVLSWVLPSAVTLSLLARDEGLTRLIRTSNFPPGLMRQALDVGPAANDQVEYRSLGRTKSAGQVALRWLFDTPRVAVVPKASSAQRRAENIDVFDLELFEQERDRIDALPKDQRDFDPAWAPDWDA